MSLSLLEKLKLKFTDWLMYEPAPDEFPMCDFERIQYELRPGDIILTEGRSRVSNMIKTITQSAWSHAALYIGRLHDIENPVLRERVKEFFPGSPEEPLVIESLLGKGTVVERLTNYRHSHIRICRPNGISRQDSQQVIGFAIGRLGTEYGVRHNIDLARFLLPWGILPRRWRSSIFEHNPSAPTKEICSSMLAEAFSSVKFPILPIIKSHEEKGLQFHHRNPKLFTPRDFDYSPYFEIIKYPIFELSQQAVYRNLPWTDEEVDAVTMIEDKDIQASHQKQNKVENVAEANANDEEEEAKLAKAATVEHSDSESNANHKEDS